MTWEDVISRFGAGSWCWLATVHPNGAPQTSSLDRASAAFAEGYGWPTVVAGGQLDAPFGAPTSGGPPYDVYALAPYQAFAFPTEEHTLLPTRWRFDPAG